jgi:hypothetical protein
MLQVTAISSIAEYNLWLCPVFLAGIFNAIAAYLVLEEDGRGYIYFNPLKHWLFWPWLFLEFIVPSLAFVLLFSVDKKPTPDISFYVKSVVFGLSFTTLVNSSSTSIGPITFSIKPFYDLVVRKIRDLITNEHLALTASFWNSFQQELATANDDAIQAGERYLMNYIGSNKAFQPEKKAILRSEIEQGGGLSKDKSSKIVAFIQDNIRRDCWIECLEQFRCTATLGRYSSKLSTKLN